MFCKYCGTELNNDAVFCEKCGRPTGKSPMPQEKKSGMSVASMVLGISGLIAWILPLIGFPVTIAGLILGISGRKKGGKGMATAGIVLCIITLVLTLCNSVAGAYIGYKRTSMPWQEKPHGDMVIQNETGETVLTIDDVDAVQCEAQESSGETDSVIQITLTDEGTEKFAAATEKAAAASERLDIFVGGEVIASPTVMEPITDGTVVISGGFDSYEEAEALCRQIRGG